MQRFRRLGICPLQPRKESKPLACAVLDLLSANRCQTQHFLATSCLSPWETAAGITGRRSRHLDPWLMPKQLCWSLLRHASVGNDLALIEADALQLDAPAETLTPCTVAVGPGFAQLAGWLELPTIGILDVAGLVPCGFPRERPAVDALLLTGWPSTDLFFSLQTTLEARWQIPILGGLPAMPRVSDRLAETPFGGQVSRELCQELGQTLGRYCDLPKLLALADRPIRNFEADDKFERLPPANIKVAVAYDDAFNCYFPDALDVLVSRGANVVDFSPLRDESLPPDTDVVYLGCGHPERHARRLALNCSLQAALRTHLCQGKTMYAEGGGMAYLSESITTPEGECLPMLGLLPVTSEFRTDLEAPRRVSLTLADDCWLGTRGQPVRGYFGGYWQMRTCEALPALVAEPEYQQMLVHNRGIVASSLHVNLVCQDSWLSRFVSRRRPPPLLAH